MRRGLSWIPILALPLICGSALCALMQPLGRWHGLFFGFVGTALGGLPFMSRACARAWSGVALAAGLLTMWSVADQLVLSPRREAAREATAAAERRAVHRLFIEMALEGERDHVERLLKQSGDEVGPDLRRRAADHVSRARTPKELTREEILALLELLDDDVTALRALQKER